MILNQVRLPIASFGQNTPIGIRTLKKIMILSHTRIPVPSWVRNAADETRTRKTLKGLQGLKSCVYSNTTTTA